MQRSAWIGVAIALLGLGLGACADEGVGDPCIPEKIPCNSSGKNCGFEASESYIESSSVQCRSRFCIVHKLDNGTNGRVRADPTNVCGKDDAPGTNGCTPQAAIDESVYCTCRCDGPKTSVEFCECPGGFKCEQVLNLGGDGIKGSYCVRPPED